jgi:hypothetical protein
MDRKMTKLRALLCLTALLFTSARAQTHNSETGELPLLIYKIQQGDTLSDLSIKYLRQPADLEMIRQMNHLRSVDLLPTGELLRLPRQAVKQSPSPATVVSLSCGRDIKSGTPLKSLTVGSVLNEGAIVDIPSECHVALLLEDSSIIRLPSSAAIKITTLRKNALEPSPEVQLDLVRGRIELDVNKGRAKTTPFEVRTPLSMTGVRGTEFRVGYSPSDQTGQVEVLGGTVQSMGASDTEPRAVTKGQGIPFDSTGKSLPIENLLNAPSFERAEITNRKEHTYMLRFIKRDKAKHYVIDSSNTANLMGRRITQTAPTPDVLALSLDQDAAFYQLTAVSQAGLVGAPRVYGFCGVTGSIKSARCRATFESPLAEGVMITFSLVKHAHGTTQELVSTKKLQARNGRFTIEGLPPGHYSWNMAYVTAQSTSEPQDAESRSTQQAGSFDLIAISTPTP